MSAVCAHSIKKPIELRLEKIHYLSNRTNRGDRTRLEGMQKVLIPNSVQKPVPN
jgi:hypothetical protein